MKIFQELNVSNLEILKADSSKKVQPEWKKREIIIAVALYILKETVILSSQYLYKLQRWTK